MSKTGNVANTTTEKKVNIVKSYNGIEAGKRIFMGNVEGYSHTLPIKVNGEEMDLTGSIIDTCKKSTISPKVGNYHIVINFQEKGKNSIDVYFEGKIWISHLSFQSAQKYICKKQGITYSTNYSVLHNAYLEGTGRKQAKTTLERRES